MAKLERTYNVPLRKGFLKSVRHKRSKKAMTTFKEFMVRHMKCAPENLKIGPRLNEKVWERGIKHPPHHVKVTAVKEDDIVKVELFGHKYPEPIVAEDKPGKKEKAEKKAEKAESKEKKKETKKEAPKKEEKKPAEKKDEKPKLAKKPTAKKSATKKTETKTKPSTKKHSAKKAPAKKSATKPKASAKKPAKK